MTSAKDFFNKIDLSKLDTATSTQIREEILTLNNEDSTVLVPNLHVDNEIWVYSGGTIMQGITQQLVIGSNKITVVNGIMVDFI